MSNRLTFSLASLVLILAMVSAPTAVMAATGGPTVMITEYSGKDTFGATTGDDHVQERDDFRVKVAFSVAVTAWDDTDAVVSGAASLTSALTAYAAGVTVVAGDGDDAGKVWYLTIDLTNDANDEDYMHSVLVVSIAEDAVTGNVPGNQKGNQARSATFSMLPKATDWTVTPTLDASTYDAAKDIKDKNFVAGTADTAGFTVNFRLGSGTSTMGQPTLLADQIQVKNSKGMIVPTEGANTVTPTLGTLAGVVQPVTFEFAGTVPHPVEILVNPNWAAGTSVWVPKAPGTPTTEIDPTVDIEPVGMPDESASTFRVKFTFMAADVTGMADKTAGALPTELMPTDIKITKKDPDDATMMVDSDAYVRDADIIMLSAGKWIVTVHYEFDDDGLPLYVGLADSVKVSAATIEGMAPATGMPSALEVTAPGAMNNAPMFATDTATRSIAENTAAGMNIGDPVTATDADTGDTLAYTLGGTDMASFAIVSTSGQLQTKAALDYETKTSYIVTVTASDGEAMDSIAVTINITNDTADDGTTDGGNGGTPAMGDVSIDAKGYAVLVNPGATAADHGIHSMVQTIEYNLPNLFEFFRDSGTIVLNGATGTAAGAVKITEIMWGEDAYRGSANNSSPDMSQWIEIQNTTAAAITVNFGMSGGWSLNFKRAEYDPAPTGAVDSLSNLGNPGRWTVPGSSGRSVGTQNADQVELVSMVRKLDKNAHKAEGWEAAIRPSINISGARVANPGSAKQVVIASSPASIDRSTVFISEIGNLADGSDWIELYNASDSAQNIKNWIISVVEADMVNAAAQTSDGPLTKGNQEGAGIDKEVVQFDRATYEDALKIPAKSYLLVTAKDPANSDSPLAVGINLKTTKVDRDPKDIETTGQKHLYYVASGLKIPNEPSLVILRNHHEKEGTSSHFRDVVNINEYVNVVKRVNIAGKWNTEVWPLQSTAKPGDRENLGTGDDSIIERNIGKTNHWAHKDLWARSPFTGLGYDRDDVSDSDKGTPGYANGGGIEKAADLKDGDITISEVMYATDGGRTPQWIELYNSSMTRAVSLNEWTLEIDNINSDDISSNKYINREIELGNVKVLPNQTVLIVSASSRNSGRDIFPDHRIIDLADDDAFDRENRLDPILSVVGFNISLYDKDNKLVDEAGNIDNNRRTDDDPAWDLPDAETENGRSSIIRRYDKGDAADGTMETGWILASDTNLNYLSAGDVYYGRATDIATPGFRGGGPLPVSLSKFRPERLETGEIVVRWITESELNNAGFNILRSEKRDGEFTKLNTKLIAGQGTTSERTAYTYTDTSAKPNVVYYYQIQDVSLEGQVTTLRTTHLRGNVSAAGKLTTTWGELKALQ